MRKLRSPQGRTKKRRWTAFLFFVLLISVTLYFIGLELWELWGLALIAGWIGWCLRR